VILASVRELAEKSITATTPTQKATSSAVFHYLTLTQGKWCIGLKGAVMRGGAGARTTRIFLSHFSGELAEC
jgi:hypothetical protein